MPGKPTYETLEKQLQDCEAALQESRKDHEELVAHLNEMLCRIDLSGRMTYVSPNVEKLGGYRPEELVGRNYLDFVHPDDLGDRGSYFEKVLAGESQVIETRYLVKGGGYRWTLNHVRPVFEGGRISGLHAVVMDITDRKETEKALQESEARYRFLVETSSDIIWTFDLNTMQFTYSSRSVEATLGTRQEAVAGNSLDNVFSPETKKQVIRANDADMRQAIKAMLVNSCEAIGDAPGRMAIRTCSMTEVDSHGFHFIPRGWEPEQAGYACLEVRDTGCGIEPEDMDKIFDPFFSTKFTGRGLGLAVVLGVAKAKAGAVGVFSQKGEGSTFRMFLPLVSQGEGQSF